MRILNLDNAARYLKEKTRQAGTIITEKYANQRRYMLMRTEEELWMVLFKRDFYNKFGQEFKECGETGLGESINMDALKACHIMRVDKVIYIYETGEIYWITPAEISTQGYLRNTASENKQVRSFSIRHLKRMEK